MAKGEVIFVTPTVLLEVKASDVPNSIERQRYGRALADVVRIARAKLGAAITKCDTYVQRVGHKQMKHRRLHHLPAFRGFQPLEGSDLMDPLIRMDADFYHPLSRFFPISDAKNTLDWRLETTKAITALLRQTQAGLNGAITIKAYGKHFDKKGKTGGYVHRNKYLCSSGGYKMEGGKIHLLLDTLFDPSESRQLPISLIHEATHKFSRTRDYAYFTGIEIGGLVAQYAYTGEAISKADPMVAKGEKLTYRTAMQNADSYARFVEAIT